MPINLDGSCVTRVLEKAVQALGGAEGEIAVDFSTVHRIDASGLDAMEKLAGSADEKGVKVVLNNVPIPVYRVLKLVKLAPRFSFRA
jgi:anti-anti-sigma regulatory factor